MRHTKSSAALITTKKGSDTNFRAEYMSKLDRLEDDEINRKLFMEKIEVIKTQRKSILFKNNSNNDLRQSSRFTIGEYSHKEQQQIFNEKRKEAVIKAKNKKENMEMEDYRQKLFIAHRREIESNIQIELRAIKIVRLWEEKRKARFVKLIFLNKVIFSLGQQYNAQRNKWLKYLNQHLMVYRIQKAWRGFLSAKGKSISLRTKNYIKSNFTFISKMEHVAGLEHKAKFIMRSFIENIAGKNQVHTSFLHWYKSIITIQSFLRTCYKRKNQRFMVMHSYWSKVANVADWNILMSNNSGKQCLVNKYR